MRYPSLVLTLCGWLSAPVVSGAEAPKAAPPPGTLEIEGRLVEAVGLTDVKGDPAAVTRWRPVNGRVEIPPGSYRLDQIVLSGGYTHNALGHARTPIEIKSGQVWKLSAGAPLRQGVTATRVGAVVKVEYDLADGWGRRFNGPSGKPAPRVWIRQGDRELAAGQFEYG